jgi:hypothetical protein
VDDIFLAAHNESPFISMPSTAYLSNSSGKFTRIAIPDSVMAHDAELVYINGKPTVVTATFTTTSTGSQVADALSNPIYTFSNGEFVVTKSTNIAQTYGQSITILNSGSSVGLQVIRGDVSTYSADWQTQLSSDIVIYSFDGTYSTSLKPVQVITPYLSTLPQYKNFPASIGGAGITHTYRLWTDDINHDGKQDILAGESMWSQTNQNFPSVLQVLINKGDGTFRDATETLNPDMGLNTSEMDYNPSFVDIDHSGIKTYLFAGSTSWGSLSRQSDYVLLNDGTGRLYVGLHDQFFALAKQILAIPMPYVDPSVTINENWTPPRFIAIPQSDGALNFVAEVPGFDFNATAKVAQNVFRYFNVPLQYNPTTDFSTNVTVSDRNGSMLMRTWAGNDTFLDINANPSPTSINGGQGLDTSMYSGRHGQYSVVPANNGIWNISNGTTIADTLTNIERLKFADAAIALDISGTGGQAYRVYQAAFNRTPDLGGVGFWIKQMDDGATLKTVAGEFVNSAEFKAVYGANPTNAQIVSKFYDNVLHRPGETDGYNFWLGILDRHDGTVAEVLAAFSESTENQAGLVGVIGNGFAYTPFV